MKYDFDFFVGIVWLVILYFYYKIILGKNYIKIIIYGILINEEISKLEKWIQ